MSVCVILTAERKTSTLTSDICNTEMENCMQTARRFLGRKADLGLFLHGICGEDNGLVCLPAGDSRGQRPLCFFVVHSSFRYH